MLLSLLKKHFREYLQGLDLRGMNFTIQGSGEAKSVLSGGQGDYENREE